MRQHNLCMVSFLESFGLDVFKEQAMWNPLCSGTTLSIISFFGNLEIGSAVIDCQAQLRIVMYLYHGLLINRIISREDIPFLDILYNAFKECKAIWCGGLPKKGERLQRHLPVLMAECPLRACQMKFRCAVDAT